MSKNKIKLRLKQCPKKMTLYMMHPDEKIFKLYPAIQIKFYYLKKLPIIKKIRAFFVPKLLQFMIFLYSFFFLFLAIEKFLLDKKFASKLGLPVHSDRGNFF